MRRVLAGALTLFCLAAPGWSQGAEPDTAAAPRSRQEQEPDVEFLDSRDAYWVTKAFNDTLYVNGGGSINACRLERDQFRNDDILRKIYKPSKVEVKTSSKDVPTLKMGGKDVKVP
ncbi:hypothetical protein IV102_36265 [bacterium]|nr:hypothetical protein [bacterium]